MNTHSTFLQRRCNYARGVGYLSVCSVVMESSSDPTRFKDDRLRPLKQRHTHCNYKASTCLDWPVPHYVRNGAIAACHMRSQLARVGIRRCKQAVSSSGPRKPGCGCEHVQQDPATSHFTATATIGDAARHTRVHAVHVSTRCITVQLVVGEAELSRPAAAKSNRRDPANRAHTGNYGEEHTYAVNNWLGTLPEK